MSRSLADFIGNYSLSRVIDDRAGGQALRFSGTAQITARANALGNGPLSNGGALYAEVGEMALPNGQLMHAERRYVWEDFGTRVQVLFEDGSAFHDFDPDAGGRATEHLCGQDMYRGGYNFGAWPNWSLTWDVEGPRKAYHSVTHYTPL